MIIKAYAKINWTLDVLGKRSDGYHELDTLMQHISLCDDVELLPSSDIRVSVTGDDSVPADDRNIAARAAQAYCSAATCSQGIFIRIEKRIPSEAGLGGGSADAAAVLRGLNVLHNALDEQTLSDVALSLGADVPFCLAGGTARCKGVGERMTPLISCAHHLLLVKPEQGVSTKELFSSLSLSDLPQCSTPCALTAYESGDVRALSASLGNALTTPALALLPQIGQILNELKENGALGASMSGSGSCCFGLFASEAQAYRAAERMRHWPFVAICRTR